MSTARPARFRRNCARLALGDRGGLLEERLLTLDGVPPQPLVALLKVAAKF